MTTDTITKLEVEASKAAQKLATARSKKAEADAAEKARREAAAEEWHAQRAAAYRKDYGGRIDRAWQAFLDAVADGGDVFGAWVHYRTERRIVAAEWRAIDLRRQAREVATYEKLMAEAKRLNVEMGLLDTTPKNERGPRWRARLAEWNAAVAAFEGVDRQPDDGLRLVNDDFPRPKQTFGNPDGPDPRERESFERAFVLAVTRAEEQALAAWQADRKGELSAHVAAVKSEGTTW